MFAALGIIGKFFGTLATSVSAGYQSKKQTEQERIKAAKDRELARLDNKTKIIQAKGELTLARINAKREQVEKSEKNDKDYDMQVLRNRNNTWADEALIVMWIIVFAAHFVPHTQNYMAGGWAAMGYNTAPWWFEFGMVGILVSTLGLMRLLRIFVDRFKLGFGRESIKSKLDKDNQKVEKPSPNPIS